MTIRGSSDRGRDSVPSPCSFRPSNDTFPCTRIWWWVPV